MSGPGHTTAKMEKVDRLNRGLAWPWVVAAIGAVGCVLIGRWSAVWRESPDFAHGWLVPIFAAYLAWERRLDRPPVSPLAAVARAGRPWPWFALAAAGAGVALLGAGRLLLEPFPTWPAALWLFSAGGWLVIGALLTATQGPATARHFAFPLLFTATALPWPTVVDLNVIVPMRVGLASIAAEVIHALGYPAIPQGTVIEVGRGQVGIDEACSGVRSLQAAIMIALLLGEIFRLRAGRRVGLLVIALALALATNLARTCFLAWQGATQGPAGVSEWHDIAGTLQMGVALGGMAGVAWAWRRHGVPEPVGEGAADTTTESEAGAGASAAAAARSAGATAWLRRTVLVLVSVMLVLEGGTRWWFRGGPSDAAAAPWVAQLPEGLLSFRASPFTPTMQDLLQCDSHQLGQWESPQGGRRAGYILDWYRGHSARQMVATHNPEICLPYSGQHFVAARGTAELAVPGREEVLPFRVSEFTGPRGGFFVFYLAWDLDRSRPLTPAADANVGLWLAYRLTAVRERQREFQARVFALAFYDVPDLAAATAAFRREAHGVLRKPGNERTR